MTMRHDYLKETPLWMLLLLVAVGLFAIFPIASLVVFAYRKFNSVNFSLPSGLNLSQLGQLGDFLGGHTSAFAGSLSLVVVLFFTFHQAKQQQAFFLSQKSDTSRTAERQYFLDGINLITQWDIKSPGCDQCMRLLDYYSRLALRSEDRELLLLLNTVITAKIRENLEGKNGSFKVTNYPYASEAIEKIRPLREADARAQKASAAAQRGTS